MTGFPPRLMLPDMRVGPPASAGEIVKVKTTGELVPKLFEAVIPKLHVWAVVGVPESRPFPVFRARPAQTEPEATAQLVGEFVATSVSE